MPTLREIYQHLRKTQGHQAWWPGESALEIAVGAILTQNTNWTNVEKALHNLKQSHLLSLSTLHALDMSVLAELIRPAGYFNIKAKRLKNFVAYMMEYHNGSLDEFFQQATDSVREQLLGISGVGPETADSIALYAGHHTVFVVDAYTQRIFYRHGLIEGDADYYGIQDYCVSELPTDEDLYNDFHAQIVMLGKNWCKKSKPDCENCPLKEFLPEDGPLMPEGY